MKFTPSGNRVLVKPEEAQDKTPGGIILPDQAKEAPRRGKIVAKGGGKRKDDGTYQMVAFDEGDTVYYTRYAVNEISLDNEEYLVINADDILGVLTK